MAEFQRFIKIEISNEDNSEVYRNYSVEVTVDDQTTVIPPNMGIMEGSMNLNEILTTGEILIGEYNANKFEIQLFGLSADGTIGPMPDVTDYDITVTDWGTEDSDTLQNAIFSGLIDSATKDDKNDYRSIVAYDLMYKYRDVDVGQKWEDYWINDPREHPTHTLREIREAVCSFVGINTVNVELLPDPQCQNSIIQTSELSRYDKGWAKRYNSTDAEIIIEDNTNVIKLNKGWLLSKLQTGLRPVRSFIISLEHKGPSCELFLSSDETLSNMRNFDIPEHSDYTKIERRVTIDSLDEPYLYIGFAYIRAGDILPQYFRNISVKRMYTNDDLLFTYKDYNPENNEILAPNISSITFASLLSAICEIQYLCPNIDRQGKLEFLDVDLNVNSFDCTDTFAKNDTKFQDYTIKHPTGLNIYVNSTTPLLKYPNTEENINPYIISGNIFLVTMADNQLPRVLDPLVSKIQRLQYTPAEVSMIISDLDMRLGDNMNITIESQIQSHCIMSQTMSGSLLVDQAVSCIANGPNMTDKPSSRNDELIQKLTAKEYNTKVDNLETKVSTLVTKESVDIEIQKIKNDGVSKIETTGKKYRFDDEGLNISDPNSDISTKIDNDGMKVNKGTTTMLEANNQGVEATNLYAKTYLNIANRCRFESYEYDRIACFPI